MTLEACVEAITRAILRQEGGDNPKSVHAQMVARFGLHNPGHLNWARQRGAQPVRLSPQSRLWARWRSNAEGVGGLRRLVRLDISRGLTLNQLISKFASCSENNTDVYIYNVAAIKKLQVNTPITDQLPDMRARR